METQEIIQEEVTNPHEGLSSSLSASSSSSSHSSSPSHTQSFASSPSSEKEISAPSSASGSSSSSSSPFSEPSSPPQSTTIDQASTSSTTGIHQDSNARVSVEEAQYHVDDDVSTSSTTVFHQYSNASCSVEEAHHHVHDDDALNNGDDDGDNNVYDDADYSVDDDDLVSLRGQSMADINSVSPKVEEEGDHPLSSERVSRDELHKNDLMNGICTGLDGAEVCNRVAMCNVSAECGLNVNAIAYCESTNTESVLENHIRMSNSEGVLPNLINMIHTESVLENHINVIGSTRVPENHFIMENMSDGTVLGQGTAEEGQKIVYNISNQENRFLDVDGLMNNASLDAKWSVMESIFESEPRRDIGSHYVSDIQRSEDLAEMNGSNPEGDSLKHDASICSSEVEERVCLSSAQAEIVLEDGRSFLANTAMHHSSDKSFGESKDLEVNDASGIQISVKLKESNSTFLKEEQIMESLTTISPEINGLKRAQTMPTGNFEVVNGIVRSRKKEDLKRSVTDKYAVGKDMTGQSPGLKISRRKQKKLVKRICKIQKDGTVLFDADKGAELVPSLFSPSAYEDSSQDEGDEDKVSPLPLQIAMLIVGTRGDVQPFVAIGKRLQEYGHRVRLATHANFEEFVLQAGLEFYPLGGDPKVLAEYMVKNKGFLPSGPSEIRTQRKQLKSIINSLLPACIFPDKSKVPFKVQAIIANPPAYGHVHVAEYLNVPLHIFFTMPWTPTSEFPHPLSRSYHGPANRISYQVVDSLIWLGIRGLINDFRKKKLKLRPITYLSGSQHSVSKLPTGYIWSPHLVPKPKDWGTKIDVVGFCFLDLLRDYQPPHDLVEWLKAGPPPIYVGFGSLPVKDAAGMTKIIVEALEKTSRRGIISRGWGGIGTMVKLPDSIYLLDNCPHDWLFFQCAAVIHHGGAGTTAAGLRAACPTTIVPFFGDQPFWGERVHAKGVGPPPIPVDEFSLDKLIHAIDYMMDPQVKQNALDLSEAMKGEDGVEGAVAAFHKHLPPIMPTTTRLNAPKMPANSLYAHLSCCF